MFNLVTVARCNYFSNFSNRTARFDENKLDGGSKKFVEGRFRNKFGVDISYKRVGVV